jgi:hypothetical protein
MAYRIRGGIDVGKDGFISIKIDDNIFCYPIPLIGKEIDVNKLNKVFERIKNEIAIVGADIHFFLEYAQAIYGSSASATFTFGRVYGYLEAFLVANHIPYTIVKPRKWQSFCWEGIPIQKKPSKSGKTMVNDTKKMSLMAIKRLMPDMDLRANERCKIPHDGKVDSLLIMYYCDKTI